jgi:hypothetical protein
MQKVEGSNPFSRFREGLLSLTQWAGAFESPGSHWVAAASPQREASGNRLFAGRLWELEPVIFAAANHVRGSASEFTWVATGSPTTARLHLAWPVGASRQPLSLTSSRGGSTGRHACPSAGAGVSGTQAQTSACAWLRHYGR